MQKLYIYNRKYLPWGRK